MAAYRRVYDSRHLQADCQEPESAPEPTLGNRVCATFFTCKGREGRRTGEKGKGMGRREGRDLLLRRGGEGMEESGGKG